MSFKKLFKKMYYKAMIRENGKILLCGSRKTHEESFYVDHINNMAIFNYDKLNHSSGTIIFPLTKEMYECCKHIVEKLRNEIHKQLGK